MPIPQQAQAKTTQPFEVMYYPTSLTKPALRFLIDIDLQFARGSELMAVIMEALAQQISEDEEFQSDYPPNFFIAKDSKILRPLDDWCSL